MPSAPRILRLVPDGAVGQPSAPIAVLATMRWQTGGTLEVAAHATAWTQEAVQILWSPDGGAPRTDWIPAGDVRRPGAAPRAAAGQDPPRSQNRRPPRP